MKINMIKEPKVMSVTFLCILIFTFIICQVSSYLISVEDIVNTKKFFQHQRSHKSVLRKDLRIKDLGIGEIREGKGKTRAPDPGKRLLTCISCTLRSISCARSRVPLTGCRSRSTSPEVSIMGYNLKCSINPTRSSNCSPLPTSYLSCWEQRKWSWLINILKVKGHFQVKSALDSGVLL